MRIDELPLLKDRVRTRILNALRAVGIEKVEQIGDLWELRLIPNLGKKSVNALCRVLAVHRSEHWEEPPPPKKRGPYVRRPRPTDSEIKAALELRRRMLIMDEIARLEAEAHTAGADRYLIQCAAETLRGRL